MWIVKEYVPGGDSPYITLYYRSFDGEEGENQCTRIYKVSLVTRIIIILH